jgi:hypothetical protein
MYDAYTIYLIIDVTIQIIHQPLLKVNMKKIIAYNNSKKDTLVVLNEISSHINEIAEKNDCNYPK